MYKQIIYFVAIIFMFFIIYKYKSKKESFETGNPGFCNSRDLRVWIEIQTSGYSDSGGAIKNIKLLNSNTAVTNNFSLVKTIQKNKMKNTGWKQVPIKSSCPTINNKVFVNKLKITCSDNIRYEWLKLKVKSGNVTRQRTYYNGNINKSMFFMFPPLLLRKQ